MDLTNSFEIINVKNALALVVFVVLFGYCVYSFLLMMRVRILAQTLKTDKSSIVSFFAKVHFFIALAGSILVVFLILL